MKQASDVIITGNPGDWIKTFHERSITWIMSFLLEVCKKRDYFMFLSKKSWNAEMHYNMMVQLWSDKKLYLPIDFSPLLR